MELFISFAEITSYIEKKYKITPLVKYVDNKAVEVQYKPTELLPAMSVTFHIEAMRKDVICLSYDCNNFMSLIISGLVGQYADSLPQHVKINAEEKRVIIYPIEFYAVSNMMEYVTPKAISFNEKGLVLPLEIN
ncbi:MAG: hypothetical protein ACI308_09380 [Muribaculaceae bacterium]